MHIINIEEDRIGLRFGVTGENRLVLLAVTLIIMTGAIQRTLGKVFRKTRPRHS